MEVTTAKPGTELSSLTASALQNTRFKERRQREAQSDVQNDIVYFSPVIRIDSETNTAILQYRDPSTGAVENQYPSPHQLDQYKKAEIDASQQKATQENESV